MKRYRKIEEDEHEERDLYLFLNSLSIVRTKT
jgi:hypothetical protein